MLRRYWGKLVGGLAGFAVGGPAGAIMGAAVGHAADEGTLKRQGGGFSILRKFNMGQAQLASLFRQRDDLFAFGVVTLSAKLAKCDGPVQRSEIDAFKQQFRIPPDAVRDVGRMFDQARSNAQGYRELATKLGKAFADNRGVLEDVIASLFIIARADAPITSQERAFLSDVHRAFGLDRTSWDQAQQGRPQGSAYRTPPRTPAEPDAYAVLGLDRRCTDEQARAAWHKLMLEHHPDRLAARRVPADFIARANEKVARINAAWDRIKRERKL